MTDACGPDTFCIYCRFCKTCGDDAISRNYKWAKWIGSFSFFKKKNKCKWCFETNKRDNKRDEIMYESTEESSDETESEIEERYCIFCGICRWNSTV